MYSTDSSPSSPNPKKFGREAFPTFKKNTFHNTQRHLANLVACRHVEALPSPSLSFPSFPNLSPHTTPWLRAWAALSHHSFSWCLPLGADSWPRNPHSQQPAKSFQQKIPAELLHAFGILCRLSSQPLPVQMREHTHRSRDPSRTHLL